MVLMQLREIRSCTRHQRMLIVLEDTTGSCRLTFYADPHETRRLVQAAAPEPRTCHPVYDFIRALLAAVGVSATRVVLEDIEGRGIGALVHVQQGEVETVVTCYPPDALALAVRERLPIYATRAVLDHAITAPPPPGESGEITGWLDHVRPQDFEA
jgi:uncharacterized protein